MECSGLPTECWLSLTVFLHHWGPPALEKTLCLSCVLHCMFMFTTTPPPPNSWASQVVVAVKNSPANAGSIAGSGRSPEGGHGNQLQYSFLENLMDRGAWWATVQGRKKSQLSYPFICWWTSRLLPYPGYYKQCDEHWGTRVSFNSGFLGVYAQ